MSASYARRMGITVDNHEGDALQVAVANGMVCSSIGTCKVRLKLQEFSADLTCTVVELADAYEVILGEDWLSKYSVTMSYEHKNCVLTKGSQRFTVFPGPDSEPVDETQTGPAAHAAPLTAIQTACSLHQCNT